LKIDQVTWRSSGFSELRAAIEPLVSFCTARGRNDKAGAYAAAAAFILTAEANGGKQQVLGGARVDVSLCSRG